MRLHLWPPFEEKLKKSETVSCREPPAILRPHFGPLGRACLSAERPTLQKSRKDFGLVTIAVRSPVPGSQAITGVSEATKPLRSELPMTQSKPMASRSSTIGKPNNRPAAGANDNG